MRTCLPPRGGFYAARAQALQLLSPRSPRTYNAGRAMQSVGVLWPICSLVKATGGVSETSV